MVMVTWSHAAEVSRYPIPGMLEAAATLDLTLEEREADVNTAIAPSAALTAGDRCDRCGAQAYLRVELATGGELHFCAHHAREHGDKLRAVAISITDETYRLGETPSSAPDGER